MIIIRGFGSRQSIVGMGLGELDVVASNSGRGYYPDEQDIIRDDNELLQIIAHIATRGFLN